MSANYRETMKLCKPKKRRKSKYDIENSNTLTGNAKVVT